MTGPTPKRRVNIQRLPESGETIALSADGPALDFLTKETAADEILGFEANLVANRWKHSGAVLRGKICAEVAQQCVATLEPMETKLEFEFERFFVPESDPVFSSETMIDGELLVDAEADDLPDVLEGGSIDVWEVILEELNLRIDLFPRKSGFEWESDDSANSADNSDTKRPFAELKALISEKNRQKD